MQVIAMRHCTTLFEAPGTLFLFLKTYAETLYYDYTVRNRHSIFLRIIKFVSGPIDDQFVPSRQFETHLDEELTLLCCQEINLMKMHNSG
jgi:hypothetical protein